MEKGRKRVRICLLVVIALAIIVGGLYYYGLSGTDVVSEGTLIRGIEVDAYVCRQ